MLDSNHILLGINSKCANGSYGCRMSYIMVDREGKLLASLPLPPLSSGKFSYIVPLSDGHLLLRSKSVLRILDKQLSIVAEYPCHNFCDKKQKTLHLGPPAVVRGSYCYLQNQCKAEAEQNPLLAKALTLGALNLLLIDPNEVWFMDKKSRVFYLTSNGRSTLVPGSKPTLLATDNCSFNLYVGDKPRILATCPEGIPLGFDDGIPIKTQIAVYDVLTRRTIVRKTGSGYFLSQDGHTLGQLQKNKSIELEQLP